MPEARNRAVDYRSVEPRVVAATRHLDFDDVREQVEKGQKMGCDVFVAGGANAAEFRRFSRAPLVEITVQMFDYALAVKKALQVGKRPAIATYRFSTPANLAAIEDFLEVRLLRIVYEDTPDLTEQLKESEADVIIGASFVNEIAEALSKKSVLLYPGAESVRMALRRACATARDLRRWQRSQWIFKAVVDNCSDGIVSIDENEDIVLFNAAAEKLIGLSSFEAKGENIRKVLAGFALPELLKNEGLPGTSNVKLNGKILQATSARLENSGKIIGAISIIKKKAHAHGEGEKSGATARERGESTFDGLLSISPSLHGLITEAKMSLAYSAPIVISGESGVGKTSLAHAIHNFSCAGTPDRPVCFANFSTIPHDHAMPYLFGSEGIFSDAATVVLERLHDATPVIQNSLLNSLKRGPMDGRIIVIVESDDWDKFRSISRGLYHCLSAFVLKLPPLRERNGDITTIFRSMVNKMLSLSDKRYKISPELSLILESYSWPGNLTEVENVARRFSIYVSNEKASFGNVQKNALTAAIGEDVLFEDILQKFGGAQSIVNDGELLLKAVAKLKDVLSLNNDAIAQKLGISRTTMWRSQRASSSLT